MSLEAGMAARVLLLIYVFLPALHYFCITSQLRLLHETSQKNWPIQGGSVVLIETRVIGKEGESWRRIGIR